VRYLQAPYLVGEMAAGAGIDARPVSSVSTFSLASERQAEILAGGEHANVPECPRCSIVRRAGSRARLMRASSCAASSRQLPRVQHDWPVVARTRATPP